ncbi:MAG: alcohol dehydrogenase [Gemmatimonadetes bacterium]|nr:alcohol dehydrogenase [Gemmatimonadota bacterium]|tara:strand:+ start:1815 stop:2969 length:1155 start_codon:yes stop_codon:yes gene_type:complete
MITTFRYPNRIVFGPGAITQLPDLLTEHNAERVLLVTDQGLVDAGLADRIQAETNKVATTTLFPEVEPNPTESCVDRAAQLLRDESCDLVIGLGGGSAMDAAKAAALREKHHAAFTVYEIQIGGDANMTETVCPIIAIPTTAGTGSEVGRSAVVTLAEWNRKAVICGPKLLPSVAVCDPELTLGLPPRITAATGMDALTHNIEAYCSTFYHPICDAVALGGIRLAAENLETAVKEGQDIEARSNMMLSSSMGAIAFQKDLGAAHSMAHPLSTVAGVPHGLANAIVLAHILEYNKPVAAERLGAIAQAMGCDVGGRSEEDRADAAIEAVKSLTERIDIPKSLSAVGVTEDQIPEMVQQAVADPNHVTNPRPCTAEDFTNLYHQAL